MRVTMVGGPLNGQVREFTGPASLGCWISVAADALLLPLIPDAPLMDHYEWRFHPVTEERYLEWVPA